MFSYLFNQSLLMHARNARHASHETYADSIRTGADLEVLSLPQLGKHLRALDAPGLLPQLLLARGVRRAIGRLLLADALTLRAPQFRSDLPGQRSAFTWLQASQQRRGPVL
ncbi:hypothetical protein NY96_06425 [Xanthomonas citri pv. fuscans]|nr:hypothetical protein NY96_06425 [Xanthomonas citri pv. fuscans]